MYRDIRLFLLIIAVSLFLFAVVFAMSILIIIIKSMFITANESISLNILNVINKV